MSEKWMACVNSCAIVPVPVERLMVRVRVAWLLKPAEVLFPPIFCVKSCMVLGTAAGQGFSRCLIYYTYFTSI
jgi:hypothetical protein